MTDSPPSSKRTGRRLIAAASVVLVITVLLAFQPLRITYHRWQMQRGRAYMDGEDADFGAGELLWTDTLDGYEGGTTHFEHHLHRLVELGAIRHKRYQLQHVQYGRGAKEGSHLFRKVYDLPSLHATSIHPNKPCPMVLEVFNEWPDSAAWDQFITTHDVPDYRERFMEQASTE